MVTLDMLQTYAGDEFIRALGDQGNSAAEIERMIARMEKRILAYIIPNYPACDMQMEAFCNAVCAQIMYEHSDKNHQLEDMPDGLSSFSVNGFSASFRDDKRSELFSMGLCNDARAELLYAGLLYRGVRQC